MKTDLDQRSIFYSVGMHLAILLIAIAGLPSWFDREEPEPVAISVEILPVSAVSNVKPSTLPLAKKEAPPKPTPKATPQKSAPPKPSEPKKESVPLPKPTPVKEAEKKEEKKPEPPKEQPKQKPKAEKTPEPKNEKESLDEILKNVRQQAQQSEAVDEKAKPEEAGTTMKGFKYDPSMAPSMSERDAIIQQFVRCWNPPAGVKNDYTLKVVVKAYFNPDGSLVGQPTLASGQSSMMIQPNFRAAADSALRAVARCAPLKNLDPSKHAGWGEMELTFDPSFLY
jgi:outer membrane biosynthesis protein TonB